MKRHAYLPNWLLMVLLTLALDAAIFAMTGLSSDFAWCLVGMVFGVGLALIGQALDSAHRADAAAQARHAEQAD